VRLRRSALAPAAALGLLAGLTGATSATGSEAGGPTVSHEVVTSFDGEPIYTTLFMPDGADADNPVPLVMRSHGWGGHGERDLTEASSTTRALLDSGYAVLTWDERGFGYSGGEVHVLKPELEGHDASVLIDWLATDPDVAPRIACESGRADDGTCADPLLGMTGGSYGGGIQLLTAAFDAEFSTTTDSEEPRVDALAPEITWNDLRYSLFGGEVLNLGWGELLYAAGVPTAHGEGLDPRNPAGPQEGGLAPQIHHAHAEGLATNRFSDASTEFFAASSIAEYGDQHPVTVPTMLMQGSVDTLFDLTEAARNFEMVRRTAPAKLVVFCGGHVSCPASYQDAGDRSFLDRSILRWFDRHLKGRQVDTGAPVVYRTNEGVWRSASDFTPRDARALTASGEGTVISTPAPTTTDPTDSQGPTNSPLTKAQPSRPGDPHAFTVEVAQAGRKGLELVGIPTAELTVSGTGPATHLFVKLVDREAGEVVNLQETPVRVDDLTVLPRQVDLTMSGIAYTLPAGHHLDLQVSTSSLMHAGARTPAQVHVEVDVDVPARRGGHA